MEFESWITITLLVLWGVLFFALLYFNIKGLMTMLGDYRSTKEILPLIFFVIGLLGIFTGLWTWLIVVIYYLVRKPNKSSH